MSFTCKVKKSVQIKIKKNKFLTKFFKSKVTWNNKSLKHHKV